MLFLYQRRKKKSIQKRKRPKTKAIYKREISFSIALKRKSSRLKKKKKGVARVTTTYVRAPKLMKESPCIVKAGPPQSWPIKKKKGSSRQKNTHTHVCANTHQLRKHIYHSKKYIVNPKGKKKKEKILEPNLICGIGLSSLSLSPIERGRS